MRNGKRFLHPENDATEIADLKAQAMANSTEEQQRFKKAVIAIEQYRALIGIDRIPMDTIILYAGISPTANGDLQALGKDYQQLTAMAGEFYAAQGALLHAMLQPFRASGIQGSDVLDAFATQESTKEQRTGINIVGELLYTLRNRAVEAAQRNLPTDNRQYER